MPKGNLLDGVKHLFALHFHVRDPYWGESEERTKVEIIEKSDFLSHSLDYSVSFIIVSD